MNGCVGNKIRLQVAHCYQHPQQSLFLKHSLLNACSVHITSAVPLGRARCDLLATGSSRAGVPCHLSLSIPINSSLRHSGTAAPVMPGLCRVRGSPDTTNHSHPDNPDSSCVSHGNADPHLYKPAALLISLLQPPLPH